MKYPYKPDASQSSCLLFCFGMYFLGYETPSSS